MSYTHRVRKPFECSDGKLANGQCVDATGWRNLRVLVDQRFLEQLPPDLEVYVDDGGDAWVSERHAARAGVTSLVHAAALAEVRSQAYPRHLGFGLWELSDGSRVGRCKRKQAEKLEAEL